MAMNDLQRINAELIDPKNEIYVSPKLIEKAVIPLNRMLDFANQRKRS
jgi:quinolinate synthase